MFQERIPATPIPVTTFLRLNSSNPARKEALTKHATRFINASEAGIRETLEITTCIDGAVVVDDRHESHSDKTKHITIDIYVAWCEPNDPDHLTKPVGCVHLYDTVGKNGEFQYRAFVRPRHKADMAFWKRYVLWADKKIKHYTEAKNSYQATLQVQISIVETKRTEIVTLNVEMKNKEKQARNPKMREQANRDVGIIQDKLYKAGVAMDAAQHVAAEAKQRLPGVQVRLTKALEDAAAAKQGRTWAETMQSQIINPATARVLN